MRQVLFYYLAVRGGHGGRGKAGEGDEFLTGEGNCVCRCSVEMTGDLVAGDAVFLVG